MCGESASVCYRAHACAMFANARSVKNALDRARMRQANRIFETNPTQGITKAELVTLVPSDILQSRLFKGVSGS